MTIIIVVVEGSVLLKPIIQAAGKDVSHWFNARTKDVRKTDYTYICLLLELHRLTII